jgi:hypothetical protein
MTQTFVNTTVNSLAVMVKICNKMTSKLNMRTSLSLKSLLYTEKTASRLILKHMKHFVPILKKLTMKTTQLILLSKAMISIILQTESMTKHLFCYAKHLKSMLSIFLILIYVITKLLTTELKLLPI